MIQIQVLNGKMAGHRWVARRFPVQLGRGRTCDLSLDEPGVWDRHAEITRTDDAFAFSVHSPALATINAEPATDRPLRNGDIIELGGVQLRFSLSPTRHSGLALREAITWLSIALLCAAQAALIYLLT
jgi:predicted component of type VI protein secretion system